MTRAADRRRLLGRAGTASATLPMSMVDAPARPAPVRIVDCRPEDVPGGAATDGFVMFNAWDVPADERGPVGPASGSRPTEVIVSRRSDILMDVQGELVFWPWRVPVAVWVRTNVDERLAGADAATLLRRTERFAEFAADDPAVARLVRLAIVDEPDGTSEHLRRQPSSPHPIRGETDHAAIRHDRGPRRAR